MVMGNAFADAVKTAKELPELGVGVHLTVVDGTPILAPKQIPSLIDPKTGRFYADHGAFVKAYAKGKIRMSDVRHEWEAQIEKFLASGSFRPMWTVISICMSCLALSMWPLTCAPAI